MSPDEDRAILFSEILAQNRELREDFGEFRRDFDDFREAVRAEQKELRQILEDLPQAKWTTKLPPIAAIVASLATVLVVVFQ